MNPEIISYEGWNNTLRLANDDFELLVTTDVGPRILVYKTRLGEVADIESDLTLGRIR